MNNRLARAGLTAYEPVVCRRFCPHTHQLLSILRGHIHSAGDLELSSAFIRSDPQRGESQEVCIIVRGALSSAPGYASRALF